MRIPDSLYFPQRRAVLALTTMLLSVLAVTDAGAQSVQTNSTIGISPYYTGSLLSPSPAISTQGLLAFEPYVIYNTNPGSYGPRGGLAPVSNEATALQTFTLLKYAVTDSLSIEALPQSSWNFSHSGFDSGSEFSDFPIELEYLLTRQDKKTGKPSITISAGIVTPTGKYQNLFNKFDGSGTGTVRMRVGALAQSLLFGESNHPIRIRAYASGVIPLTSTNISGFSTYGTDGQFNGVGYAAATGAVGGSVEYSFTQKFVFALDAVYGFSASSVVVGHELNGTLANSRSGPSQNFQLAPAFEYSFNDDFGIIAGCAFTLEGQNTSQVVQPQIAFNFIFDTNKPYLGFQDIVAGLIP